MFEILYQNEKIHFTAEHATKNTDYIEKCFKQKLFGKFLTKKSVGAYVYLPSERS